MESIIYSNEAFKPRLKEMWKLCFGDSDSFIDFYFDKIYRNDNTLILLSGDGLPVASLQILLYQIKIKKSIYDARYISGAMTHPAHRKKGYMKQLLNVAFKEMKKQDFTFSFLIPQEDYLFDFYAKHGYEKAFPKSDQTISLKEISPDYDQVEIYLDFKNLPINEIYYLYNIFLNQKENTILKTQEQFEFILENLFIDNGCLFYLKNKSFAFVATERSNVLVKEIFNISNDFRQLFAAIKNTYQTDIIILPNKNLIDENNQYYGMIKVLDTLKFLRPAPKNIYMSMMMD